MTPEGIGGGFGEPPKDVGGKENFSMPEDVGRQDDKEVVNPGVEPEKKGDDVSTEDKTEVLTGEVSTPSKEGDLEPATKDGSAIDFSKKEPAVGGTTAKHEDVGFDDKEEFPEDTEEKPNKERSEKVNEIKDLLIDASFLAPTDDQKDRMAESMESVFKVLGHKVKSVSEMDNIIRDFEEKGNRSSYSAVQAENMRTDRQILSEAVSLAADDLTRDNSTLVGHFYLGSKHVDNMMDSSLTGLGWEISKRFIGNRSIDKRLNILEITRKGVDMADESSRKTYLQKLELTIERLGRDEFEDDSDVIQQDAVLANLYGEKKFLETVSEGRNNDSEKEDAAEAPSDAEEASDRDVELPEETESWLDDLDDDEKIMMGDDTEETKMLDRKRKKLDERVVAENLHDREKHRSPYEITPYSFVDSLFNYENPRMYTTPLAEWVAKLSKKDRYLLKIQQKLAIGAQYYLGVKDISMDKTRTSEVYNLPTTELRLLYEMPMMREAMETFWNDLFERYEEDGRVLTRLKQCRKLDMDRIPVSDRDRNDALKRLKKEPGNERLTLGDIDDKKVRETLYYVDPKDVGCDKDLVRSRKNKLPVINPTVARWLGDMGTGYSFESYKEERYQKMALKRIFAGNAEMLARIDNDVFSPENNEKAADYARRKMEESGDVVEKYIDTKRAEDDGKAVENFIKIKREFDSEDDRSDAELEEFLVNEWKGELLSQWEAEWRRNNSWGGIYDEVVAGYISEERKKFKETEEKKHEQSLEMRSRNPRSGVYFEREDDRTDAQIEDQWVEQNAFQEKRVWACTALLAVVNLDIQSADVYRQLKPSQIMSDKTRTFMMPLEKFLQKEGFRKAEPNGEEEPFGRASVWAKKQIEIQGQSFIDRVLKAADGDRTTMTNEQAMYRIYPKRVMCGFSDMYKVQTEGGIEMTMSEALLNKRKMKFIDDDLDVFKTLRDPWDELLSVTPFMIGKAEYSPVQQMDKFKMVVEKMQGVNNQINTIRLTRAESERQRGKKFGSQGFANYPEFYAWVIANSIGLRNNLDIPVLKMSGVKFGMSNYDVFVNMFTSSLDLSPELSVGVKKILYGKKFNIFYNPISDAEDRAASRETKRIKAERRFGL